ncbi:MAG: hypothetical protein MH825_17155 [Cyanobacteria bacterium]|nr:hypothetical protein [Cyanobacteriota bacterium]
MDSGFMLGVGLAVANGAVCVMLPLWVSGRDRAVDPAQAPKEDREPFSAAATANPSLP